MSLIFVSKILGSVASLVWLSFVGVSQTPSPTPISNNKNINMNGKILSLTYRIPGSFAPTDNQSVNVDQRYDFFSDGQFVKISDSSFKKQLAETEIKKILNSINSMEVKGCARPHPATTPFPVDATLIISIYSGDKSINFVPDEKCGQEVKDIETILFGN